MYNIWNIHYSAYAHITCIYMHIRRHNHMNIQWGEINIRTHDFFFNLSNIG